MRERRSRSPGGNGAVPQLTQVGIRRTTCQAGRALSKIVQTPAQQTCRRGSRPVVALDGAAPVRRAAVCPRAQQPPPHASVRATVVRFVSTGASPPATAGRRSRGHRRAPIRRHGGSRNRGAGVEGTLRAADVAADDATGAGSAAIAAAVRLAVVRAAGGVVGAGPVVPQAGGRGTPGSGQGGQGGAGDPREDIAARDTGRAPANQIVEAVTVHGCSFRWAADTAVEPRAIRRAPRGWSMGDRRLTASVVGTPARA